MFGTILNAGKSLLAEGEKMFNRVIDTSTFKRVVYAAYLIASADGDFDSDERQSLVKFMKRDFPDFDTSDILTYIKECDAKLEFDKRMGIQEIIDEIARANTEDALMIMRVCAFIGEADGTYDADEKLMARSIALALGLPLANYNL